MKSGVETVYYNTPASKRCPSMVATLKIQATFSSAEQNGHRLTTVTAALIRKSIDLSLRCRKKIQIAIVRFGEISFVSIQNIFFSPSLPCTNKQYETLRSTTSNAYILELVTHAQKTY